MTRPPSWLRRLFPRTPARPADTRVRLGVEVFEERITPYSASGNKWEVPALVTISFMPDGTSVSGKTSNLVSTFNTKFGSAATWQNVVLRAAQVWAEQTNINFKVVTDNGAAAGSGANRQGDPGFGDIRIGGYNFGAGNTTLAAAYMPPLVNNYSIAGDISFNTGQTFNVGSTYDLFTVAAHEIGHALGLNHGAVGSVMASAYPGTLTALNSDDVAGIRNLYSANAARAADTYDAAASNATTATASVVTTAINTTTKAGVINNLDLTTAADVDVYKFVVPAGSSTTLKARVNSLGLSLLNPKVEILDSAGVVKATATAATTAYGANITATFTGVAAGATYYVRVSSTNPLAAFKTGKYALVLNMGTGADPAITFPTTLRANGTPLTSGGGTAVYDGIETLVTTTSSSYSASSKSMLTLDGSLVSSTASDGEATTVSTGDPTISMDASGNYVVVWVSANQDGSGQGVFAKRYNALGVAQGSEFRVNSTTAGDQSAPAVAMAPNGEFVVTWQSYDQDAAGTWGVYARRFKASGAASGAEFRVSTATADDQITPAVAMDGAGNFVIAWASHGATWDVFAQRYSHNGNAAGGEFRVNANTFDDQLAPVVGVATDGTFTVGWSSYSALTHSWGVSAQRYDADGAKVGREVIVNTTYTGNQRLTHAAMTPDGKIMFVWTSTGQDGSGLGVYARRFDAAGAALGGEFRVNSTTAGDQTSPSVAWDSYGNFNFVWQSYGQDAANSWGIYGQQFGANGDPIGGEFRVNSTTAGDQLHPIADMDHMGHLVVVWNGSGTLDGDGVFMQRYSVNTSLETPEGYHAYDPEGHDHDHDHDHEEHALPAADEVAPAAAGELGGDAGGSFAFGAPDVGEARRAAPADRVVEARRPAAAPAFDAEGNQLATPAAPKWLATPAAAGADIDAAEVASAK